MVKGTAIVQGLKNLVHSQLPLSTKESQRLLTALTSSFRRHLDEVHPPAKAQDDQKTKTSTPSALRISTHAVHSSASHAENHLASVLTNPLLASPLGGEILDYASAKVDLTQDPHKDPIELLERYDEKGAANVRIAELCLETFVKRLEDLPEEQRTAQFREVQPGRRTLFWLLKSGLFKTQAYIDNVVFVNLLAHSMIVEGLEAKLWDWLQLNEPSEHETDRPIPPETPTPQRDRMVHNNMMRKFRWRGRLLNSMIGSKLYSRPLHHVETHFDVPAQKVHDGLDVYLRAYDIYQSSPPNHHLRWIPLNTAGPVLYRHLTTRNEHMKNSRMDLDPHRFDRYVESKYNEGGSGPIVMFVIAKLQQFHPRNPSAEPAYGLFCDVYGDKAHSLSIRKLYYLIDKKASSRQQWFCLAVRTVFLLRETGQHDKAEWVKTKAMGHITELAKYFEVNVAKHSKNFVSESRKLNDEDSGTREREERPESGLFPGQRIWRPAS